MKKVLVGLLLIIIICALALVSCIDKDGVATGINESYSQQATQSANITATYGAEQFFIQLTAIAVQDQK